MNDDFQKRLARLEAKNGPVMPKPEPAPQVSEAPPSFREAPRASRRGGALKMTVFAAACLLVLPAGAVFVTMKLPQIMQGASLVMALAEEWSNNGADDAAEPVEIQSQAEVPTVRTFTARSTGKETLFIKSSERKAAFQSVQSQSAQNTIGGAKRLIVSD